MKFFKFVFLYLFFIMLTSFCSPVENVGEEASKEFWNTEEPKIRINSHTNGQDVQKNIRIFGDYYCPGEFENLKIYSVYSNSISETNSYVPKIVRSNYATNITLPTTGYYYLWTEVKNRAGRTGVSKKLTLAVENLPVVKIDNYPEESHSIITHKHITIKGQTIPAENSSISKVETYISNHMMFQIATNEAKGTTNWSLYFDEAKYMLYPNLLVEGTNYVSIAAFSDEGKKSIEKSVYLILDTKNINVDINSPAADQEVAKEFNISGIVDTSTALINNQVSLFWTYTNSAVTNQTNVSLDNYTKNFIGKVIVTNKGYFYIWSYSSNAAGYSITTLPRRIEVTSMPVCEITAPVPEGGNLWTNSRTNLIVSGSAEIEDFNISKIWIILSNRVEKKVYAYDSAGKLTYRSEYEIQVQTNLASGTSSWSWTNTNWYAFAEGKNTVMAIAESDNRKFSQASMMSWMIDTKHPQFASNLISPINGSKSENAKIDVEGIYYEANLDYIKIFYCVTNTNEDRSTYFADWMEPKTVIADTNSITNFSATISPDDGWTFYQVWAMAVDRFDYTNYSVTNVQFVPQLPNAEIRSHQNGDYDSDFNFVITGIAEDANFGIKDVYLKTNSGQFEKIDFNSGTWRKNFGEVHDGTFTNTYYAVNFKNIHSPTNSTVIYRKQDTYGFDKIFDTNNRDEYIAFYYNGSETTDDSQIWKIDTNEFYYDKDSLKSPQLNVGDTSSVQITFKGTNISFWFKSVQQSPDKLKFNADKTGLNPPEDAITTTYESGTQVWIQKKWSYKYYDPNGSDSWKNFHTIEISFERENSDTDSSHFAWIDKIIINDTNN